MNDSYLEHPCEEALERHALRRSPGSELEAIENHVIACEQCIAKLEELEDYTTSLKSALREMETTRIEKELAAAPKQSWRTWFSLSRLPLAGGLAAAALATVLLVPNHRALSPVNVDLTSTRGVENTIVAKTHPLHMQLDANEISEGPVGVQVVNEHGMQVWEGKSAIQKNTARVNIAPLKESGRYFVRLYADGRGGDGLLREFSFRVQ